MRDRCIMKYHAKYTIYLWKFYERKIIFIYIFENINVLLDINNDYSVYLYV